MGFILTIDNISSQISDKAIEFIRDIKMKLKQELFIVQSL